MGLTQEEWVTELRARLEQTPERPLSIVNEEGKRFAIVDVTIQPRGAGDEIVLVVERV